MTQVGYTTQEYNTWQLGQHGQYTYGQYDYGHAYQQPQVVVQQPQPVVRNIQYQYSAPPQPQVVEKPVYIQQPPQQHVVEKVVERPVYIEKVVEKEKIVDRPVFIQTGPPPIPSGKLYNQKWKKEGFVGDHDHDMGTQQQDYGD